MIAAAFYRDMLGLATTPADAQDSARPRARAAVSGRDSRGFCGPDRILRTGPEGDQQVSDGNWLHAS